MKANPFPFPPSVSCVWLCLAVLVDCELASELVAPDEDDDDVTIADDNMDSCYALSL